MVKGSQKSRSPRRVKKRTPNGNVKTVYLKRKPKKAVCAVYKTPLAGVARARPTEMQNMPKTAKRPERPYGGVLSSKAMREKMKEKARATKL